MEYNLDIFSDSSMCTKDYTFISYMEGLKMRKNSFAFIAMISWIVVLVFLLSILVYGLSRSQYSHSIPSIPRVPVVPPVSVDNTVTYMENTDIHLIKEETFSIDKLTNLSFDSSFESLIVEITDSDELTVLQYGDPELDKEFKSSIDNGNLKINLPGRDHANNYFDFSFMHPRLEIYIPEGYSNAVSLESSSGSIDISGYPNWSDVSVTSSSGSININELNALNADIQTSSGSLNGQDITVKKDLKLSSNSGTIQFNRIICKEFNIQTTSGGFFTDEITGSGDIESSSGSLNINDFTILGNTKITSSSGSINMSTVPSQNYKLNLQTSSGGINCAFPVKYENDQKHKASGTVGNGSAGTLSVSTDSGSINID